MVDDFFGPCDQFSCRWCFSWRKFGCLHMQCRRHHHPCPSCAGENISKPQRTEGPFLSHCHCAKIRVERTVRLTYWAVGLHICDVVVVRLTTGCWKYIEILVSFDFLKLRKVVTTDRKKGSTPRPYFLSQTRFTVKPHEVTFHGMSHPNWTSHITPPACCTSTCGHRQMFSSYAMRRFLFSPIEKKATPSSLSPSSGRAKSRDSRGRSRRSPRSLSESLSRVAVDPSHLIIGVHGSPVTELRRLS